MNQESRTFIIVLAGFVGIAIMIGTVAVYYRQHSQRGGYPPSKDLVIAGIHYYQEHPGGPLLNVTQDSLQAEFLKQSQLRMNLGLYPYQVTKQKGSH